MRERENERVRIEGEIERASETETDGRETDGRERERETEELRLDRGVRVMWRESVAMCDDKRSDRGTARGYTASEVPPHFTHTVRCWYMSPLLRIK